MIPVGLQAQECANADFQGRYASLARLSILAPDAQQNNWHHRHACGKRKWEHHRMEGYLCRRAAWRANAGCARAGHRRCGRSCREDSDIRGHFGLREGPRHCLHRTSPSWSIVGALVSGGKEFLNVQTSPDTAMVSGVVQVLRYASSDDLVRDIQVLLRRLSRRAGDLPRLSLPRLSRRLGSMMCGPRNLGGIGRDIFPRKHDPGLFDTGLVITIDNKPSA